MCFSVVLLSVIRHISGTTAGGRTHFCSALCSACLSWASWSTWWWWTVSIRNMEAPCRRSRTCCLASPSSIWPSSCFVHLFRYTNTHHVCHWELVAFFFKRFSMNHTLLLSSFPPDLWRQILLRAGVSLVETPHGQHGRTDRVSHLYRLHLLLRGPCCRHGWASQPEPRHILRHSTYALCVHRAGTMAGAHRKGKKKEKKLIYLFLLLTLVEFLILFSFLWWWMRLSMTEKIIYQIIAKLEMHNKIRTFFERPGCCCNILLSYQ